MAIQLYSSNDLNQLAVKLCSNLYESQPGVFDRQYVVTQTAGINNWLNIRMAEEHGISANTVFFHTQDLIHQVYFWLVGSQQPPISQKQVQWSLYLL